MTTRSDMIASFLGQQEDEAVPAQGKQAQGSGSYTFGALYVCVECGGSLLPVRDAGGRRRWWRGDDCTCEGGCKRVARVMR